MTDEIRVDGIFDAKLVRENKSAKGIFITLEVAADDYYAAKLSDVRPGAVLKIGYREVLNVEVEPIEIGVTPRPLVGPTGEASLANEPGNRGTAGISKPKQHFADMPLVKQCAMICEEPEFARFLNQNYSRRMMEIQYDVATFVREFCNVTSRKDIRSQTVAAANWDILAKKYETHKTSLKYAGSIRR